LSVAEDSFGGGWVQPFGEDREHYSDLMRRGFQAVERSVAPRTESGAARLAAEGLDLLGTAMLTITNQRVDLGIDDPAIGTLLVGTGKALGVHPFRCSPPSFDLAPRSHGQRR
jgi:hypothetical protein